MKYLLVIAGLCFLITNCTHDHLDDIQPSLPPCNQLSHTWSLDVVPLLTTYCTNSAYGGCHESGSQYGDWTDYVQFKYKVDGGHVKEHCLDRDEMPPPYSKGPRPLKAMQKQVLRCWIEDGAQEN